MHSVSLVVDLSSELVLVDVLCELVEVVLVDGPRELDVDPDWRAGTGTGGCVFEDVPGSFCGTFIVLV